MVQFVNTRLALGEQVDPAEACSAVSAMVRIASRLGLSRRARDLGPPINPIEYGKRYLDEVRRLEDDEVEPTCRPT